MKCLIFLMIFTVITEYVYTDCTCQTSVALCQNIRKCLNCELDDNQESDCGVTHENVQTEEACLNLLAQSEVINAVQWDPSETKCVSINCVNVSIESDDDKMVYWKTCDSGCRSLTVTEFDEKRISDASNETLSIGDEDACFRKCLEQLSQSCMVTYNSDAKMCYVYRGCNVTECPMQIASNFDTYLLSCNKDCGPPTMPANGSVSFVATTVNSLATYTCHAGFLLNGSTNTTCEANGNWSASAPTCTRVNCGQPHSPANGHVNYSDTLYGNQAVYGCNLGFNLSGQSTRTCMQNGSWSSSVPVCFAPDCGPPTMPANGSVSFVATTVNSLATYTCHAGFLLNGSTNNTCEANGNWRASAPTCTRVNCGQPHSPANGHVNYSDTLYGNQAVYGCNQGFNLSRQSTRTCMQNGFWGPSLPVCLAPGQTVKRKPLYIMPCLCYPTKSFTNMTTDQILAYLKNATSIDTKNTSAALDKLRSRSDSRMSSAVIGTVGIVILSTLAGLMVCLDLLTICRKNKRQSYHTRK